MAKAIDETNRRRAKQVAYNKKMGVDPQPLRKKIADITDMLSREEEDTAKLITAERSQIRRHTPSGDLVVLIEELSEQMRAAAGELQFELAARLRDEISDLKKELRGMQSAEAH